jgi:hypothetical protein
MPFIFMTSNDTFSFISNINNYGLLSLFSIFIPYNELITKISECKADQAPALSSYKLDVIGSTERIVS